MDIQERINRYWSMRADEFSDAQLAELKEYKRMNWTEQIKRALPDKKRIRALDLGTGAGFFSIILHDLNCEVVGIDYSQEMINHAIMNSEKLNCNDIWFLRMDAQSLEFPDESFDFIFTRNVTWTLPDPEKAYLEMIRVLAPGGRLMNCDANYGAAFLEADRTGEAGAGRERSCGVIRQIRAPGPEPGNAAGAERYSQSAGNQQPDPPAVGCRYTDQPGNEIHNRRYEY